MSESDVKRDASKKTANRYVSSRALTHLQQHNSQKNRQTNKIAKWNESTKTKQKQKTAHRMKRTTKNRSYEYFKMSYIRGLGAHSLRLLVEKAFIVCFYSTFQALGTHTHTQRTCVSYPHINKNTLPFHVIAFQLYYKIRALTPNVIITCLSFQFHFRL